MDAVFSLSEVQRTTYLRLLMQSFDSTYICLWSYSGHPSNWLLFVDGYYQEETNQPSSSSTSHAGRLFDEYSHEFIFAVNDRVPGHAFRSNLPYIELNELDLQRKASVDKQQRFYQQARIKTAVFMGCRSGEIEVGWSKVTGINIQNEMRNWFPEDFTRQSPRRELSQAVDPSRQSSSSSSLRSLSMDSPDSSSLLFNIPCTAHIQEALQETPTLKPIPTTTSAFQQAMQSLQPASSTTSSLQQAMHSLQQIPSTTSPLQLAMQNLGQMPSTTGPLQQAMQALQQIPSTTSHPLQPATQIPSTSSPHQQAMELFGLTRNAQLPTRENEDAVMTRAILTVLTSPSSSSSSSTPNFPFVYSVSQRSSAFRNYTAALAPVGAHLRRQSMFKRAITYYRSLNIVRREHMLANRPTSTQLHHMISERRRREKLNESFQALRSLLPPDTKKDKASVLIRTREFLTSLKAQVAELSQRNQKLEAQLLPTREAAEEVSKSSSERLNVRITHLPESTSDQQIIDLQVTLRGECPISEMVIRILEFLKQVQNVNLMSIEGSTQMTESSSLNRVVLRLKIEGNEWDESAFQEAVKRVVADLAQ